MPKESTNLKLKLYNAVADSAVLAKEWFNDIFDYTNSNWTKIDNAYKELLDLINHKVISWNEIRDKPDSIKNPNALTIQGNGTELANYDGGEAKTVNITKDVIGLNNVDNTSDANKKIEWDNILNKPSFISSSILPYTVEYDGFYKGNGKSISTMPLTIPVSKEYDAIGIVFVESSYSGYKKGRRNTVLYKLVSAEPPESSFSGTFLPVSGVPTSYTTLSNLSSTLGKNMVENNSDPQYLKICKTDSGLKLTATVDSSAWNKKLNTAGYTYYIFGLNLNSNIE